MKKAWLLLWPVLVLALFTACHDKGRQTGLQSATPSGAATGIAEVDAVVRAVVAGDVDALLAMTSYTTVECTTELGGGGPPLCSSVGVPPGTAVETLPIRVSESEYWPRAGVPALFKEWLGEFGLQFAGILKPTRHPFTFSPSDTWPVPDYAVVFKPTRFPASRGVADPDLAFAFYLLGGRIIAVQGFGIGAATLPAPDDPSWLIPPRR